MAKREYTHRGLLALAMVFFAIVACPAASIKISLRSGEAAPSVGQPFYLEVTLQNVHGDLPSLKSDGAKMLYQAETGHMESERVINGHRTSSFTRVFTVTMRAEKEGKITISPIVVGGVRSNALTVNVGKQRQNGAAGAQQASASGMDPDQQGNSRQQSGPRYIGRGNDNLFMVASVNKTTAYEQEALVYTVKLYSSFTSIRFIGATESPKFDGFTLEEANPKVESLHFENYKGKQYACAIIARYIIFPQMKGKLTIRGNRYTVTAESRPEYWDPFWGVLSYGRPVQLSVQPNDLTIDVRALPQPQPANFSGGVGQFSIKASMPSRRLATNQAASIVYTVSGRGNIKYITLPDLAVLYPKEFEVSTPTPDVNAAPDGSSVSGTAKFDCSFMPMEEGQYTIPAVELVYFNPATGKYETARSQSFKVEVVKGKASAASSGSVLKFDSELMSYKSDLKRTHTFWAGGTLYYWLYAILLFVAISVLGGAVYYRRRHADMEGLMARRARRLANRLLRDARKSMKKGDRDRFFDNTLTALWGYAANKMRMPGSEMQRSLLESNFAEHQVSKDVIERFIALIDRCEEAKYAGQGIGMQEVYNDAANIIRDIDSQFKK